MGRTPGYTGVKKLRRKENWGRNLGVRPVLILQAVLEVLPGRARLKSRLLGGVLWSPGRHAMTAEICLVTM